LLSLSCITVYDCPFGIFKRLRIGWWWSTIPPISRKQLISSHLISLKQKPTWDVGIPVSRSGQANHVAGLNLHLIIRCFTYCWFTYSPACFINLHKTKDF
jgi:hypothetical protein